MLSFRDALLANQVADVRSDSRLQTVVLVRYIKSLKTQEMYRRY